MWVPETDIPGLCMGQAPQQDVMELACQETRAAFEMVRGPNLKHRGRSQVIPCHLGAKGVAPGRSPWLCLRGEGPLTCWAPKSACDWCSIARCSWEAIRVLSSWGEAGISCTCLDNNSIQHRGCRLEERNGLPQAFPASPLSCRRCDRASQNQSACVMSRIRVRRSVSERRTSKASCPTFERSVRPGAPFAVAGGHPFGPAASYKQAHEGIKAVESDADRWRGQRREVHSGEAAGIQRVKAVERPKGRESRCPCYDSSAGWRCCVWRRTLVSFGPAALASKCLKAIFA